MKKVNKYTALFSSSKGPAIHILSGRRVKFEFASTKRRDECFKILEKAVIEWRVNNCLGDISVTSIPGGKLHYKISLLAGAWTPDVVFSSHLRVDNRTVSAGSYRLWNTSTGETISRRDIINASERGNLENLIPQGVPIRFTNSEIVPKAVNSIEVIFNRVYGNVDKIELEYILP